MIPVTVQHFNSAAYLRLTSILVPVVTWNKKEPNQQCLDPDEISFVLLIVIRGSKYKRLQQTNGDSSRAD